MSCRINIRCLFGLCPPLSVRGLPWGRLRVRPPSGRLGGLFCGGESTCSRSPLRLLPFLSSGDPLITRSAL